MKSDKELAEGLLKKFTGRSTGEDVISAIIAGFVLFILILALMQSSGGLAVALSVVVVFQLIGMIGRMVGWRVITLRNDEQDFLRKVYAVKLKVDSKG